MEPVLLIPIYEPSEKTNQFLVALTKNVSNHLVIVDDGSGPAYQEQFQTFQALSPKITVLHYQTNQGKGFALKYGISFIQRNFSESGGIVTADGDGQHSVADIKKILEYTSTMPHNSLLLGVRDFDKKTTPAKSYWGNHLTSIFFFLASGIRLADTQTGLRGFKKESYDKLLSIPGNRFEYEMNVLLALQQNDLQLEKIPIQTIYEENNAHSHFRPLQDSLRIYFPLIGFLLSSILSSVVDVGSFLVLAVLLGKTAAMLLAATIAARIISGIFNYAMNRKFVFKEKTTPHTSIWKYTILFTIQLTLSWLGVTLLSKVITSLIVVKMMVDICLFFFSFFIQKRYVFAS